MKFSTSNQLHINDHLKAHMGYKSCSRTLGREDLMYGGTRTHDLVVESPDQYLSHSAIRPSPNWTRTIKSQKFPMYTKYLPLRSKFRSDLLYDQRFPRYHTFYKFLIEYHVKRPPTKKKKNKKFAKNPKFEMSQFFIQLL